MTPEPPAVDDDARRLAELGYTQELHRGLNLFSNFAVGFTYLSPVVGVYGLFAYGLATGGGAFIWALPIVMIGQLFVTLIFGEVASQYPIAGGIYQWTRMLVGERYAWFSGWMYLWALLINIAAATGAATLFLGPLFGYEVTRQSTIITVIVLLAIGGLINFAGVRWLSLIARAGVIVEIGGTVVLGIIFLVSYRNQGFGAIFDTLGVEGNGSYIGAFLAASLFGVWCLYGHESAGAVGEEVVDASRRVPRAMILALLIGACACFFITLSLVIAVPSLDAVMSGEDANPILTIFTGALGEAGAKVALVVVLVAFISCVLATQAATTRLVYSYARDNMIMGSSALRRLHPRFKTPPVAVFVVFAIPSLVNLLPSTTIARVIAFAVVGNYIAFSLVVIGAAIARGRGWTPAGHFRLGSWAWPVTIAALAYQIGAIVVLSWKTPPFGDGFFDRWFVPISAAIVALVGLAYYVVARPRRSVSHDLSAPGSPSDARL